MSVPSIHEIHFEDAPNVGQVPGPRARELLDRQLDLETHAVAVPDNQPLVFEEGRGATVKDVDGNIFLDFMGGLGVLNVGHSNPYVLEGVTEQAGKIVQTLDFPTEARIEFMEKLNEIAPSGLGRQSKMLFGGPTGSDIVEGSIKLVETYTGNSGLIAFHGAYHGQYLGSLSLSTKKDMKQDFRPGSNVEHVAYPYPFYQDVTPEEAVERSLDQMRTIIEDPYSGLADPAGIWVEPVQGTGGTVTPPNGFLKGLRKIATENDIPLIVDEVFAGMGRTGRWWGCEWEDVTPDIMLTSKGIGGIGLPLSSMMYRDELDVWETRTHVGTFRGQATAMRAGVRAIEFAQTNNLLSHTRDLGEFIKKRFKELAEEYAVIADVRGRGLFIGVELVDQEGKYAKGLAKDIVGYCFEHGVIARTVGRFGNTIQLTPPLVLTREQAEIGMEIMEDGFAALATEQ